MVYVKICVGVNVIQFYMVLVYEGFSLIGWIKIGLVEWFYLDGFVFVFEVVGVEQRCCLSVGQVVVSVVLWVIQKIRNVVQILWFL